MSNYRIQLGPKSYLTTIEKDGELLKDVTFVKLEIDVEKRAPILTLRILPEHVSIEGEVGDVISKLFSDV